MPVIPTLQLQAIANLVTRRMGSNDAEAAIVADHLVSANLAGHGIDTNMFGVLCSAIVIIFCKFTFHGAQIVTVWA